MTTVAAPPLLTETVADLLERLGDIPPRRVRMRPLPGTATEPDVVSANERHDSLYELVDGTLVEKAMGYKESLLAVLLIETLGAFVRRHNLGLLSGPDGMMRLVPGLVRMPDVAFVSWQKVPGGRVPDDRVAKLSPDLAIEVLSDSNTRKEMARKRQEYFQAGTRLVWEVDPESRTVTVYTSPDQPLILDESRDLNGGDVIPGFIMPLKDLFAELDRHARQ